jgi:hypothetical protein
LDFRSISGLKRGILILIVTCFSPEFHEQAKAGMLRRFPPFFRGMAALFDSNSE